MKNYEINDETIAIISKGNKSQVITLNDEFIVEKSGYKILDDSCKFYGSSYLGRLHSVKEMLSASYKLPIIGHSVNLPTTFKVNEANPKPKSDNNEISKNWFKEKKSQVKL